MLPFPSITLLYLRNLPVSDTLTLAEVGTRLTTAAIGRPRGHIHTNPSALIPRSLLPLLGYPTLDLQHGGSSTQGKGRVSILMGSISRH